MTSRCQGLFPPTQFKREKPWERGCPNPISDQTLTLFRLLKHLRTAVNSRRSSNLTSQRKKINEEVASSKNCTQFQIRVYIRYRPIGDQNGQNLYPIADQNGSKTTPFGAAHTYMAYIREYPTPWEQTIRHSFMNVNHNREFSMLLFQLKGQVLRVFCVLVKIVQKSLPTTSIDTRSCKTGRKISNEFWQGD